MTQQNICLVSSEVAPFAKTGGLADVAAGLGRYLGASGHDVRIIMPLYARIADGDWQLAESTEIQEMELSFGDRTFQCRVRTTPLPGQDKPNTHVYFIDCPEAFGGEELYGGEDEHVRFALLTRAAIEACQRMQWAPDIFHCNDWHTGLLPLYLRTNYAWDQLFQKTRTLLTIHNIGYQGTFPIGVLHDLGLMAARRHLPQDDFHEDRINFLKTGVMHADALTTVSKSYAHEIQTEEFGMGLETLLRQRQDDLHGIVNGVDYGDWDPASDPLIPHRYSPSDLSGKQQNKRDLLAKFEIEYAERTPLIGIVSRLTGQKGFELLPDILPILLQNHELQLCVLGSGESKLEQYFQWLRDTYPTRVAVYRGYNNELAHLIEAGADMFLMPSRYEPCGLNQMYSLRYGTAPIVRRTGGLADTVQDFNPENGTGTGFVFDEFESKALFGAIRNALTVWDHPQAWARLVQNGMAMDFSWERQGREYESLYTELAAQ